MSIITLTTDWGLRDHYVAAVKGAIYSRYHDAIVVDISHLVPPFDIIHASFILKHAYPNFPKGSIHVIGVNTQSGKDVSYIAMYSQGHYFIGADNGIFSLICDEHPEKIIELNSEGIDNTLIFPTKNIFVKAACHLAQGGKIEELGTEKSGFWERVLLRPAIDASVIRGSVIYIDSYGNVITNITQKLFNEVGRGRSFTIFFRKFNYNITALSKTYNDVPEGEKLALFNTLDLLEIAMNQGKANGLLGLKLNDSIRIEFDVNPE